MLTVERQIDYGDARVSYGDGEKPKWSALRRAIDGFYGDLARLLAALEEDVFAALPVLAEGGAPFRYTAKQRRLIEAALTSFLVEMAGPDRSREGFVTGGLESETPDGVLQQRSLFTYAIGLERAASVAGRTGTLTAGRQNPAVLEMLDGAFSRLSENGKLRLEGVRDEIHSVLVSATDAGISPLETGRQLANRFDQYRRFEFERLARTEAAFAAEAANRDQMRDFGVTEVVWLISSSACPICRAREGKVYAIEDVENHPPEHPNCLCSLAEAASADRLRGLR